VASWEKSRETRRQFWSMMYSNVSVRRMAATISGMVKSSCISGIAIASRMGLLLES
jgi:hypothetical protein